MKRFVRLALLFVLTLALPCHAWGASWTVMIYMAADNDLERFAIQDFLELSSVGSTSNVNIVVQLDRAPGYDSSYGDWTETNRFYVTRGMTPTQGNAISNWGDGRGGREVNMGDPAELKSFVEWAMNKYPANHYLLVIWNHGQGWKGRAEKETNNILKWVVYDDTNSDVLWAYEIREALKGKHIDVIAMDACLMGTIEVMAELLEIADYFVASEAEVPGYGFPYDTIASELASNPSMTPRALSETIVSKYEAYYKNWPYPVTLSAVDMSKLNQVIGALNSLAEGYMTSEDWNSVKSARDSAIDFPLSDDYKYQVDLGSLMNDPSLKSLIEGAVFKKYNSPSLSEASGISIYFPKGREYNPFYSDSRRYFLKLSSWNDFLKSYLKGTAPKVKLPMSKTQVEIDGNIRAEEREEASVIESNGVKIYLKCDERYLYIGIDDPKDSSLDQNDRVGIYFDANGDWSWPDTRGTEGNYWVAYNGTSWQGLFRALWGSSGMPYSDQSYETVSSEELSFATSLSGGHLQYEIRIDYTLRWGLRAGDEVHLYMFVYDAKKEADDIDWPQDLTGVDYGHLSPCNYGKVKLGEAVETPAMEISPEEIDFGEVKVDETKTKSIIITNVGSGTLNVEASLEGEDSSCFSISPSRLTIPSGGSMKIDVSFKPKDDRSYRAYVLIQSNDPLRPISYVTLTGEGKKESWPWGGCTASGSGSATSYLLLLVPLLLVGSLSKKDHQKGSN